MTLTASKLRRNVYRLLDRVIETGEPLVIERKGQRLQIIRESGSGDKGKLDNLTKHNCIVGDPEGIVHCDWSDEWGEGGKQL